MFFSTILLASALAQAGLGSGSLITPRAPEPTAAPTPIDTKNQWTDTCVGKCADANNWHWNSRCTFPCATNLGTKTAVSAPWENLCTLQHCFIGEGGYGTNCLMPCASTLPPMASASSSASTTPTTSTSTSTSTSKPAVKARSEGSGSTATPTATTTTASSSSSSSSSVQWPQQCASKCNIDGQYHSVCYYPCETAVQRVVPPRTGAGVGAGSHFHYTFSALVVLTGVLAGAMM